MPNIMEKPAEQKKVPAEQKQVTAQQKHVAAEQKKVAAEQKEIEAPTTRRSGRVRKQPEYLNDFVSK